MQTLVTYPPEPPNKDLVFTNHPLENGIDLVSSRQSRPLEVTDSMTSTHSLQTVQKKKIPIRFKNKESVIAESLQLTNETTLPDRLNTCNQCSLITESLQTSVQESTSDEKVYKPYWNCQCKELSKKLWLPIETDFVDSPSNSSSGYFQLMEPNSWFSIKQWIHQKNLNLQAISSQSLMSSIVGSTVEENTKKTKKKEPDQNKQKERQKKLENKMRKKQMKKGPTKQRVKPPKKATADSVRVVKLKNLTPETKQRFRKWFGDYRKTYNWALDSFKKHKESKNLKNMPLDFRWFRNRFVNADNIPKNYKFLLETPKAIREGAVKELVTAIKTNFTKVRTTKGFTFDMKFKSRKTDNQTIPLTCQQTKLVNEVSDNRTTSFIRMFPASITTRLEFFSRRNKNLEIKYDCRLRWTKKGEFYLHIPVVSKTDAETPDNQGRIVSGDPGVRTFLTTYSPTDNSSYKLGDNDIQRLVRLGLHIDKLTSNLALLKQNKSIQRKKRHTRYLKLLKVLIKSRERVRNLVRELHYKVIKFLFARYDIIILPATNISSMVKKAKRKIKSKTVRSLLSWSHYKFRCRLEAMCKKYDKLLNLTTEEYTTKTCSNCGWLHTTIGGNKKFICKNCGVKIDRDVNGSRGILILTCTKNKRQLEFLGCLSLATCYGSLKRVI